MAEPVDAIMAFHNAFRNDLKQIDTAALDAARGKEGLATTIERFRFFNEFLVWHAHGEELAIFPALEKVAPLVAEAYVKDHRGLDAASDELDRSYTARDPLQTARATAAFRFHLNIHLYKEDTHLYRIFKERVPMPEQWNAIGLMAKNVPPERFPEAMGWLFLLIGQDDRENLVRVWQTAMPAPVFAGVKGLIKKAIRSDWADLTERIPTLND
ncbi:MAG: hemerythrin domain-containing protein [Halobacteriota archaeon]